MPNTGAHLVVRILHCVCENRRRAGRRADFAWVQCGLCTSRPTTASENRCARTILQLVRRLPYPRHVHVRSNYEGVLMRRINGVLLALSLVSVAGATAQQTREP